MSLQALLGIIKPNITQYSEEDKNSMYDNTLNSITQSWVKDNMIHENKKMVDIELKKRNELNTPENIINKETPLIHNPENELLEKFDVSKNQDGLTININLDIKTLLIIIIFMILIIGSSILIMMQKINNLESIINKRYLKHK